MIQKEPIISVGIIEGLQTARGVWKGKFHLTGDRIGEGGFSVGVSGGEMTIQDDSGNQLAGGREIACAPVNGGRFVIRDVVIGVQFHWERKEDQTFEGSLRFVMRDDGLITVINDIPLENYLTSVISSEMSAESPIELLKAHAITSRSWLVAMLEREDAAARGTLLPDTGVNRPGEIIRWYSREDHDIYDVCADDHCQRYQGITKIISEGVAEAIDSTRGLFLVHDGEVCDARYYKACGGLTEEFQNAWEDVRIPYLRCVSDAPAQHPPIATEEDARRWILSSPDAYCNTSDPAILRQVLPSFDQETTDFYRWEVSYERQELEKILKERSGIDFGILKELIPLERGPSGRMVKLRIVGTQASVVVGKDLEIRRWLSPTHLYSSAFVVKTETGDDGNPKRFLLRGAGWGHGVGLCQIGAAVMAVKGFAADSIAKHYFRGAEIQKLY
jgi:stage II sporulation protein D